MIVTESSNMFWASAFDNYQGFVHDVGLGHSYKRQPRVHTLFQNSVMLGCFETFFAQHGLLYESFLAVFLHGTLNTAIIIAAAGGLAIGNGWLFPAPIPAWFPSVVEPSGA